MSEDRIFFSVIIPTFNRSEFLPDAIVSVLNQNYQHWELIVVDDGSIDNTSAVVKSFNDSRIRYFFKKHEERSVARNFGIEKAKGEYICFLDSDDIYYNNHLQVLSSKITEKDFPVAIFNTASDIDRNGDITQKEIYNPLKWEHPLLFVWEKFLLINSVCVHIDILKQHKFPEKFHTWEDTHLWLRVVAQYPFYQIDKVTNQWNIHSDDSIIKRIGVVSKNKYEKLYVMY